MHRRSGVRFPESLDAGVTAIVVFHNHSSIKDSVAQWIRRWYGVDNSSPKLSTSYSSELVLQLCSLLESPTHRPRLDIRVRVSFFLSSSNPKISKRGGLEWVRCIKFTLKNYLL